MVLNDSQKTNDQTIYKVSNGFQATQQVVMCWLTFSLLIYLEIQEII